MKAWTWSLRVDACVGCGICVDLCRPGALSMTAEMPSPVPLEGRCVGCMVCVRECPVDAVVVEPASRDTARLRAVAT